MAITFCLGVHFLSQRLREECPIWPFNEHRWTHVWLRFLRKAMLAVSIHSELQFALYTVGRTQRPVTPLYWKSTVSIRLMLFCYSMIYKQSHRVYQHLSPQPDAEPTMMKNLRPLLRQAPQCRNSHFCGFCSEAGTHHRSTSMVKRQEFLFILRFCLHRLKTYMIVIFNDNATQL